MHKKILLLGSGELGKELVIALKRLGQTVIAVDSYAGAPAMQVADGFEVIDMLDGTHLDKVVSKHNPDLIVPEIEAIFFTEPAILERIVGTSIGSDLIQRAETLPRRVLEELLSRSGSVRKRQDLLTAIEHADLPALRDAPPIRELIDFVSAARTTSLSAA